MSSIAEGAPAVCSLCGCRLRGFTDAYADPPTCRSDAGWTKTLEASKQPPPPLPSSAPLADVIRIIRYAYALEFADAYAKNDLPRMRHAREWRNGVAFKTSARGVHIYTSYCAHDNLCVDAKRILDHAAHMNYK